MHARFAFSFSWVAAWLCLAVIAPGGEPQEAAPASEIPSPDDMTFFEQRIRPLLVERCYACHSQGKEIKGGLRLDVRSGWQTGGDTGPAILPGKPDESLLIKAVRYLDGDLKMPPAGKLGDAELATLEEWVRRGAPDPRDELDNNPAAPPDPGARADPTAGQSHWAFQPLRQVTPGPVQDRAWPLGDVDRFVLSALEAQGLHPSGDADRHAWLRRVSLDLTGLPPTREEILAFDQDANDAYEQVVDRLLATRAFGERWARPWLDLVGYADQIGSANNVPAEHAWRYRDYVIRAIAADKPFDQFVREQLAGDLLSASSIEERQDQLLATGFLVLGNVNIVEADKLIMRMDLVDQQIEKIGKAFLGLTLQCARCHDHKFDPVTLHDYYGLAGIFGSTESTYKESRGLWSSVTKTQLPETLAEFTKRELALRAHDRKVAPLRADRDAAEARLKELDTSIQAARASSTASPTGGSESVEPKAKPLAELEKERAEVSARLNSLELRLRHLAYLQPSAPLAYAPQDGPQISDARIQVRGNPHVLGDAVPRGFVAVTTHGETPSIGPDESGRQQLAEWLTHAASPLVARVTVNRLWQGLFGRGIVASVDYFGVRGDLPTHPDLLEYLSARFIQLGWSRKQILRELVLSRVYRQSSASDDESRRVAMARDPENHLLWRFNPRRLDAEMLRDSVLAVSGGLERDGFGPALVPEFLENVGGLDPKDVNPISFSLTRFRDGQDRLRTIYLPVVRSSEQRGPAETLNFFDFAQPARIAGSRPTTAVASQALFLLNGPLWKESSRRLASLLLADNTLLDDSQRLEALYWRVLSRAPDAAEVAAGLSFLADANQASVASPGAAGKTDAASATDSARAAAADSARAAGAAVPAEIMLASWQSLVHALLISNEFLFRL